MPFCLMPVPLHQIQQLEQRLESLKNEKHLLFSQLKKVLHQEDENRKRAQIKEQKYAYYATQHQWHISVLKWLLPSTIFMIIYKYS